MIKKGTIILPFLFIFFGGWAQDSLSNEINLAGVYQGKTLFIQNPFDKVNKRFCVEEILINERRAEINYKLSAIKLDFEGYDLNTPVRIKVLHKDSVCNSVIINPEAILFHTIFRFTEVSLTDSALVWKTKGERGKGNFVVEKLYNGIWIDKENLEASANYSGSEYSFYPNLEEGANKYRIRYNFPAGNRIGHLYSRELDYDFYPEPVEFSPKLVKTRITLSRSSHYEIYDEGNNLVLEGQGVEIDVRVLRRGRYIIYFNRKDPGSFQKE